MPLTETDKMRATLRECFTYSADSDTENIVDALFSVAHAIENFARAIVKTARPESER